MNKVGKEIDVIIIGAAIVDLPLRPVSKEVFDVASYPVDGIAMTIGGDALNESTIITRLGHKVALMSCIGVDVPGAFVLDHCKRNHIDTTYIKQDPSLDTSINVALVAADGERTFITNRQGSLWKFKYDDLDMSALKDAKILSFASIFNNPLFDNKAMVSVFKKAKEEGMMICADMINPRLNEKIDDIAEALSYVDFFFPNFEEASALTGENEEAKVADKLYAYGIKNVIMKIGRRGCYIRNSEGSMIVPACKGVTAMDTIGAGDNFASGFITGLLEGKDIRECAIYANCTAAVSVQYVGATVGVTDKKIVDEMLAKYREDYQ
ncbi:carbohydrate kinase family protein [Lacrimispora sp.]|uniref:carbohydrate kinase family protein n=1 Tax=Lacrimispora sp. TaxID=2719234 RepID=UPI00345FE93C